MRYFDGARSAILQRVSPQLVGMVGTEGGDLGQVMERSCEPGDFSGPWPSDVRVDVGRPGVRPTWVDRNNGWVIHDVVSGLADPGAAAARRQQLTAALARTASVLGASCGGGGVRR